MISFLILIIKILYLFFAPELNWKEDNKILNDYYSTQTDVYENVNNHNQAKKPDFKKLAEVDEVEFSVVDVDSTKYQMVTESCWCRSVIILNMKVTRKSLSSD